MSKWISVEEQLPPLDTKILCYCEDECGGELQKNIHFGIYFGGDLFCVTDTLANARVIAWMPLPKPPKYANKQTNQQTNKQTKE